MRKRNNTSSVRPSCIAQNPGADLTIIVIAASQNVGTMEDTSLVNTSSHVSRWLLCYALVLTDLCRVPIIGGCFVIVCLMHYYWPTVDIKTANELTWTLFSYNYIYDTLSPVGEKRKHRLEWWATPLPEGTTMNEIIPDHNTEIVIPMHICLPTVRCNLGLKSSIATASNFYSQYCLQYKFQSWTFCRFITKVAHIMYT